MKKLSVAEDFNRAETMGPLLVYLVTALLKLSIDGRFNGPAAQRA
jgi:hypothetical protein